MDPVNRTSKGMFWTGWILTGLIALLLLVDGIAKLLKPAPVIEATVKLGYPESSIVGIGVVLITCTALYLFPRTAILGAVLLTGYLGGAVATHVRAGEGAFPIVFALAFGVCVWIGLWLRDARLRAILPLRS